MDGLLTPADAAQLSGQRSGRPAELHSSGPRIRLGRPPPEPVPPRSVFLTRLSVLFFIHLESHRILFAACTESPDSGLPIVTMGLSTFVDGFIAGFSQTVGGSSQVVSQSRGGEEGPAARRPER